MVETDKALGTDVATEPMLQKIKEGRGELNQLLTPLFKHLWTKALESLADALPHTPGDCSENEQRFHNHRRQILRVGNDLVRQLPLILSDFAVQQICVRSVTTHTVKDWQQKLTAMTTQKPLEK